MKKTNKISCIWIQVTTTPRDPLSAIEFPIGTRVMLNKKKFPYLYKYGYLWFKRQDQICKLYEDEIEVIVERRYSKDDQEVIEYNSHEHRKEKDGDRYKS
jgi:hypothetical protein